MEAISDFFLCMETGQEVRRGMSTSVKAHIRMSDSMLRCVFVCMQACLRVYFYKSVATGFYLKSGQTGVKETSKGLDDWCWTVTKPDEWVTLCLQLESRRHLTIRQVVQLHYLYGKDSTVRSQDGGKKRFDVVGDWFFPSLLFKWAQKIQPKRESRKGTKNRDERGVILDLGGPSSCGQLLIRKAIQSLHS